MDVDLAALRAIERDKDISEEYLIKTLEDALLNAYNKTPHALRGVKVEVNRKTGKVSVLAPEFNDDDEVIGYFDDTPDDFGRIAAATARQVIFQRIREAEDDQKFWSDEVQELTDKAGAACGSTSWPSAGSCAALRSSCRARTPTW